MELVEDTAEVTSTEASTASTKATTEIVAPTKASTEASTTSSTEASTTAFREASTKVSTKALAPITRYYFHGSKRQLPRRVGGSAASTKAFRESLSSFHESWKLHLRNFRFTSMEASAASTESHRLPRQLSRIYFVLYTTVPPVELTTFSTTWLTHTVYETNGVLPYIGCWVRVRVRVRVRVSVYTFFKSMSTTCREHSQKLSWQ